MRSTRRRVIACGLAALLASSLPGSAEAHKISLWSMPAVAEASETASFIGSFDWKDDRPGFGGFSGFEMAEDGLSAVALSDRGYLIELTLRRDEAGRILAVNGGPTHLIRTTTGEPVTGGHADSEGLRRLPDGRLCVSFENNARISCHASPEAAAELLPRDPDFAELPANSSLESLAADLQGRLYTIPEDPDNGGKFRVYRFEKNVWQQPFTLPARDGFLATDADFGPDGRLYVLERKVALTSGFLSRVRSFAVTEDAALDERIVIEPSPFRHGNLEGLSVWQDQTGAIRLTMIADNAQMKVFRNEIAEYSILPSDGAKTPG